MKLNWLRAGCASIAECGGYTAMVCALDDGDKAWFELRDNCSGSIACCGAELPGANAAEAACEAWLEQHDKPVWHDVTEWLSWAEWRGCCLYCRRSLSGMNWEWYRSNGRGAGWSIASRDEAKAAAEKYVREQTIASPQ